MHTSIKKFVSFKFLLLFSVIASSRAEAQSLTCQTLPLLFTTFLSQHVVIKNLTPDVRKKAVDQFVKNLDSSKSILLDSDLKQVRSLVDGTFFSMRTGNCDGIAKVNDIFLSRVKEIEADSKEILGPKFTKVDDSVILTLDPEKRKFPTTAAERKELLRASINFQVWNLLDTGIKLDEAKQKIIHRYELLRKRAEERDQQKLLVSMVDAFAGALDPHTSYMEPQRQQEFNIDMTLQLEGIGASLSSEDGYTIVEEIIPGGAADRSGLLRKKDKIVAVAQEGGEFQAVVDMELKDVVRLIRGKKGTKVRLSILRKVEEASSKVEAVITRDKVDLKDQAAKIKYEDRVVNGNKLKFAILDLPSFYGDPEKAKRTAYDDVKDLIADAKAKKADGLVLNLERNGGGLLQDAVRISGLFIEEGAIVATQSSNGKMDILRDRDAAVQWSGPLIVLTSRASASASEILAGALKDYKRAVIVGGDHTFGKGTVQAILGLTEELGAIKITTGMFFVPGGFSTQYKGVEADVALPSTLSTDEVGERQLDNALEPKKVASFLSPSARVATNPNTWKVLDNDTLKALSQSSKERVAKNEDFKKILKDIADAKKSNAPVKLAEIIKKSNDPSLKKKIKSDEKKTRQQLLDEYQKPYIEEALNVLGDLTLRQRGLNSPAKMFIGGKPDTTSASTGKTVTD
jgi:carboxyl-terminal processing protease